MAGNVFVNVIQGDLVVTGDGEANELRIIQALQNGSPIAGRYFITGQNNTAIIGTSGGFVQGVTDDIRIYLYGNNDRLTLGNGVSTSDFIVPDDLEIDMGDGNNVVTIDKISVRDDATIVTGAGSDSVSVKAVIGGLAGIDGGANDLNINTGNRSDNVLLQNTFVRRNVTVDTRGTDNFSDVVDMLMMNIGNDTIISTGGGGDLVRLADVGFNDDVSLDTGEGNDTVTITRCQFNDLIVLLFGGSDQLTMTYSSGQRASLNGGNDSDTIRLGGYSFTQLDMNL
jgi:hypothetical protein